jgi:hypothetical protein
LVARHDSRCMIVLQRFRTCDLRENSVTSSRPLEGDLKFTPVNARSERQNADTMMQNKSLLVCKFWCFLCDNTISILLY